MSCNRRRFLSYALCAAPAVVLAPSAIGACVDPDEMSESEHGMRESMEYTDASSQAGKMCNGCAFFKAREDGGGCGDCEVLAGPVSATGYCVSWTARD